MAEQSSPHSASLSFTSLDDWFEAVQETFAMELGLHDISQSVARLVSTQQLIHDSYRSEYRLSDSARQAVEVRLEEATNLERRVESRWLET